MGKETEISWCDHTFNPFWGCTKVSPGCDNCYASTLSTRWGHSIWGPDAPRRFFGDKHWAEPVKWNADATKAGERKRVFCGSMCDWAEGRPDQADARARLFALIEATPMLDWLLLTKRPGAIRHLVPAAWLDTPPPNVWYGTSCENQEQADRRIPQLLRVPAVVRFLSCEPLLGPVNLFGDLDNLYEAPGPAVTMRGYSYQTDYGTGTEWDASPEFGIDWVIAGGESGHGARPCHPDWVRSLRDECAAVGVAFHFKQWGEYEPYEENGQAPFWNDQHGRMHDGHRLDILDPETGNMGKGWHPDSLYNTAIFRRVGKKAAGRLLDGRTWDEFPTVMQP